MCRRGDGNRFTAPIKAHGTGVGVNGGEAAFEERCKPGLIQTHLASDGGRVQKHRTPALGHHLAEVFAGDHVAWRQFSTRVDRGHIPFATFVEQGCTFAAYRFGNQEVLAHAERGGVELVELEVGDLGSGTPRGGQPVTGGDLRVRGERVQSSGATGRENHTIACQRTLLASGRVKQANTANGTGNASRSRLASRGGVRINRFSDQIHDERVLDDMDVRRVACDGTDIKLDDLAGRIPARVYDAAAAVRGLQSAQQRAVRMLVEAHAGGDEPAHLFGAFTGENIHGFRFA